VDTMSLSWEGMFAYAFPRTSLASWYRVQQCVPPWFFR
jgi:hypothetical protein